MAEEIEVAIIEVRGFNLHGRLPSLLRELLDLHQAMDDERYKKWIPELTSLIEKISQTTN